jgi:hypothetical protein
MLASRPEVLMRGVRYCRCGLKDAVTGAAKRFQFLDNAAFLSALNYRSPAGEQTLKKRGRPELAHPDRL